VELVNLAFLGLTHYYGHFSLASWGSGTGGAGLIGAGAYVICHDYFEVAGARKFACIFTAPVGHDLGLFSFYCRRNR